MSLDFIVQDVSASIGQTSPRWFHRLSRVEQARWVAWWKVKFGPSDEDTRVRIPPRTGREGRAGEQQLVKNVRVTNQTAAEFWLRGR